MTRTLSTPSKAALMLAYARAHGYDAEILPFCDGIKIRIPWIDVNTGEQGHDLHFPESFQDLRQVMGY